MYKQEAITIERRNGNLHINLAGVFTSRTAAELTTAMKNVYTGTGNIFIHTSKITDIAKDSTETFCRLLGGSGIEKGHVYMMGERGMDIGVNAVKVITPRKKPHGKGGCGRCKNCSCLKN